MIKRKENKKKKKITDAKYPLTTNIVILPKYPSKWTMYYPYALTKSTCSFTSVDYIGKNIDYLV